MKSKQQETVKGFVIGRNGVIDITKLEFCEDDLQRIWITGIGKSGKRINGGFCIIKSYLNPLILKYQEALTKTGTYEIPEDQTDET